MCCYLVGNVDVEDARDVLIRWQSVLKKSVEHCRLVNKATMKWNANNQRTLMS